MKYAGILCINKYKHRQKNYQINITYAYVSITDKMGNICSTEHFSNDLLTCAAYRRGYLPMVSMSSRFLSHCSCHT